MRSTGFGSLPMKPVDIIIGVLTIILVVLLVYCLVGNKDKFNDQEANLYNNYDVIMFDREGCGYSAKMKKLVNDNNNMIGDYKVVIVDMTKEKLLSNKYNVRGTPHFALITDPSIKSEGLASLDVHYKNLSKSQQNEKPDVHVGKTIIVGNTDCPFCRKTYELFKKLNIDYDDVSSDSDEGKSLMEKHKARGVPLMIPLDASSPDDIIIGYNEDKIKKLHRNKIEHFSDHVSKTMVVGNPRCPYCRKTYELFKKLGIDYDDVSSDSDKGKLLMEKHKASGVPLIIPPAASSPEDIIFGYNEDKIKKLNPNKIEHFSDHVSKTMVVGVQETSKACPGGALPACIGLCEAALGKDTPAYDACVKNCLSKCSAAPLTGHLPPRRGCWKIGDSSGPSQCHGLAADNPNTFGDLWTCVERNTGGHATAYPGDDGCQQCVAKEKLSQVMDVRGTGGDDCTWGSQGLEGPVGWAPGSGGEGGKPLTIPLSTLPFTAPAVSPYLPRTGSIGAPWTIGPVKPDREAMAELFCVNHGGQYRSGAGGSCVFGELPDCEKAKSSPLVTEFCQWSPCSSQGQCGGGFVESCIEGTCRPHGFPVCAFDGGSSTLEKYEMECG